MGAAPLVKVGPVSAAEICARFQPAKAALKLLRDGMGAREFVEALLAERQYVAGIDFLAHALPPREGIWWGCLCLQHAIGEALTPLDRNACIAAVQWVLQPGEESRAAAGAHAAPAGPASAAGSLAMAAFLTGGNIAPPKAPPAAPAPFASAKSIAGAVKTASSRSAPALILETQRAYAELGLAIAEGKYI